MKSSYFKNIIGGAILALSLLLGIGMSGLTAQAQNRDYGQYGRDRQRDSRQRDRRDLRSAGRFNDDYPDMGGTFELRQTALNAGYNEGIKQGRNDRQRRRDNDFRSQSAYQRATKDYSSRLGDRELYREYYRLAYEHGYQAGLNGY